GNTAKQAFEVAVSDVVEERALPEHYMLECRQEVVRACFVLTHLKPIPQCNKIRSNTVLTIPTTPATSGTALSTAVGLSGMTTIKSPARMLGNSLGFEKSYRPMLLSLPLPRTISMYERLPAAVGPPAFTR